MEPKKPSFNCCLIHSFQPRRLFCFCCKYFYCHICCEEKRKHGDHSVNTIHLPLDNFEFERCLGAGKNGCVFMVTKLEDGHGYALKIIPKVKRNWEIELVSSKTKHPIVNISHPNIIEYKRSYHIKEDSLFVIIRELADKPLQSEITYISQNKAFSYFIQIMEALRYLHDDLKIPKGT